MDIHFSLSLRLFRAIGLGVCVCGVVPYVFANSCASAGSTITISSNQGQCRPKTNDQITINSSGSLSAPNDAVFLYANGVTINNIELINHGAIHVNRDKGVSLLSRNGGSTTLKTLTNEKTGTISANRSSAIKNDSNRVGTIINKGEIFSKQYAIYNNKGFIDLIKNIGNISAKGTVNSNYGIRNDRKSTINTIDNRGVIAAQDRYAVANISESRINIIKNQGDMIAKRQTIANYASIGEINNKGLVKSNQDNAIFNTKIISKITNHKDAIVSARSKAIFSSVEIDNITNHGLINSKRHTIINFGVVNEINNGGGIRSDGVIAIYNGKEISEIVNNDKGIISSGDYTLVNRGKINTLENKGLIKTKLGGNLAVAIRSNYSNSVLTTLNNYNLIDGKIETKGTELNLYGKNTRVTGDVANTGGSVHIKSGAQFASEASFNSQSFAIENNATLQLGDSSHQFTVTGTGANAFDNSGTLVLSGNQTANITGNYTQSGILKLQTAGDSDYGKVAVKGNAVLTEAAKFDVDVNTVNTLAAGQTLYGVVRATGTFSNKAPKTNVTDNSYLFDFESIKNKNGHQVDLRIIAASKPDPKQEPKRSLKLAAQQGCLRDGLPTARVLDKYIRGGQTNTDWDNVVSALGRLPNKKSVANALGQTMPLLHGNLAYVAAAQRQKSMRLLDEKSLRHEKKWVWVQPTASHINQSSVNCYSGYQANSTGLSIGMDFFPESSRHHIGVGMGYAKNHMSGSVFSQTHAAKSTDLQLNVYGNYDLKHNRLLSWYAGYTHHILDTSRGLPFINRVATGRTTGHTIRLGTELRQAFFLPKSNSVIEPLVGFDFRTTHIAAFSEKGAGFLNYFYDKQKAQEALVKTGVKIQYKINPNTKIFANATIAYDVIGRQSQMKARFQGNKAFIKTKGLPVSRFEGELGLGMQYQPSERVNIEATYQLQGRKRRVEQSAGLRFEWVF